MPKIRRDERRSCCSQLFYIYLPCKVKRKHWSYMQMRVAMDAVKKGTLNVKRAAVEYKVPKSTLQDRILGKVIHGINPGAKPYLNQTEEKYLG